MVEPEMTFADLTGIINLAEKMIKQVVNYVLDNNIKELEFFENYTLPKKELVKKLKEVSSKIFVKVDYDQCIEILKKKKEIFVFNDIK
jgi:asparaginyl-tRNA synthetase